MLARLEEASGVERAEVDRRGELLHLRLRSSTDLDSVIDRLQALGFLGEVIPDANVATQRWYGPESVGELSREEAAVIAQRVVPVFVRENGIGVGEIEAVKEIVVVALHACFIGHAVDAAAPQGALNDECGRAVERATTVRLGPDRAAALGRAVENDLASRSAFKE